MKTTLRLLTEEGRTRFKNAVRRIFLYLILSFVFAGIGGYLIHRYWVSATLTTLQRVYLNQYLASSYRSYLPNAMSRYMTLVRVVTDPKTRKDVLLAVHDKEIMPVLDDAGHIQFDENHYPVILLRNGIEHKWYGWKRSFALDKEAYEWFYQKTYSGKSIPEIWRPAWLGALLLFSLITIGLIALDMFAQGRYLKGESIRGTRELLLKAYAREHRDHSGYGIAVYNPINK